MAFEMPLDQIKQLQILLRREANLSWYDPDKEDHLTLPKLPSVAETVAKLDPSPPYLRCKNCNGRLLRGVQSSICAFCGANPRRDLPPEPIKFTNTLGYRWLLESLQLDGSEMVAPVAEENASGRGKSEPKYEIPLSELLNLEIRWPSEAESTLSSSSDSVPFQGKPLNLAGVDLDSFFDQRESDFNGFEQNLASRRKVGDTISVNTSQADENLSLFQNVQASEDHGDDSLSGWDANFMSASSGPVNEEPISFSQSNVGLGVVSGSWKDSAGVEKNDDFNRSESTADDWFRAGGFKTFGPVVPSQTGKQESSMDLNDTKPAASASGSSTRNLDWMQDDQWHSSDKKTTATAVTDEADDSFDAWDDFTGSASTQDPSNIISSATKIEQIGKPEIAADLNDSKATEGNISSFNDFDWMQDDQWPGRNNKTTDTRGTNEVVDTFDAWNGFTGSANPQHSSSNLSTSEITGQTGEFEFVKDLSDTKRAESASGLSRTFDWMQDDQWHGGSNKATGTVTDNEVDDSFDAWNDFTGSSITQNPSSSVSNSGINGLTGESETLSDFRQMKTEAGANASVESYDWMQDDQWQVSKNKSTGTMSTNEVSNSFDAWDGFTSMAATQVSSSSDWKPTVNQSSSEQALELNLFSSSNNSHDMEFSGFSQHDLFSGQFSSSLSSPAATNTKSTAAPTNRVADVDAAIGNSRDVSTAQVGSRDDDLAMLMSQMHDLSFMLESNLSIPPK